MNPYKEILRKFFSEYIDTLRKRRGLTQEQMAEKLRITGRAYSDLERDIYGLLRYLGLSAESTRFFYFNGKHYGERCN